MFLKTQSESEYNMYLKSIILQYILTASINNTVTKTIKHIERPDVLLKAELHCKTSTTDRETRANTLEHGRNEREARQGTTVHQNAKQKCQEVSDDIRTSNTNHSSDTLLKNTLKVFVGYL